jgi:hypothetical protein
MESVRAMAKQVMTVAMLVVLVALPLRHARADDDNERDSDPMSGMIGITAGQTARLNVVNAIPQGPPSIPGGPPTVPSGPPQLVELMFVDSNGNQLLDAAGVSVKTTLTLGAGESAFLDLNANAIPKGPPNLPSGPPDFGGRVQLRALVRAMPVGPPQRGEEHAGSIITTLEVFDNVTAKTSFVMLPLGPPNKG